MHQTTNSAPDKQFLQSIYDAALQPALPEFALRDFAMPPVSGRVWLFAAGKAATGMAAAVLPKLPEPVSGLVVTRQGCATPDFAPSNLEIIEAAHPVPDIIGLNAAQRAVMAAAELGEGDLMLALISGGASSLLPLPVAGVTLDEKQQLTRQLLHCGAPISEINIIRKHLSAIKGGRLATAAWPARTMTIAISDVPGDDPATIGSGPTVGDSSSLADARAVAARYGIALSDAVANALQDELHETPDPNDERLSRASYSFCARPADLVQAAADAVRERGYEPLVLGDDLEGDAAELGKDHAQLALRLKQQGRRTAIISGGEATVTISNPNGRGGRNTAFLLSCALELGGAEGITGFAADTDGIDGSEDNAGAFLWPGLLDQLDGQKRARAFLGSDDSYSAFDQADALMMTGPSGTNVNDLRVLLVE
ncbi:MAG: glycerate kinase [Pseudomonadota bacterium]